MSIREGLFNRLHNFFLIRQNVIYLGLIVLLGLALRLYNLGTESFWFDEIITVYRVQQDFQTLLRQMTTDGEVARNAVYFILAHFWVLPFEITEVSIRSLSALFGVLSIGMMYLTGEQLFGVKVGLISSFLMAVSTFQIQHSQEARFYSLFVLLTLISLYFYVRALRTNERRLWIINSFVNLLLFYTHTYAVFVIAVEYFHYLFYWRHNKGSHVQWAISQLLLALAMVVGFLPIIKQAKSIEGFAGGLAWITTPSFKDLAATLYGYLFPQNYQHNWAFIGVGFIIGLIFFVTGTVFFNYRKAGNDWFVAWKNWFRNMRFPAGISSELTLAVIWLVFPVLLPFIYSNLFSPIFVARYTICAAPALYLLVAVVISRIGRVVPIYVSLGALMIVIVPGLQDYYVADINEQWQEVAVFVNENSMPNDIIVFAPDEDGYQSRSFDWYYGGELPVCGISSNIKDDVAIAVVFSNCASGHGRSWVIIRGPSDVIKQFSSFFLNPEQPGTDLIREQHFVNISVYLFELPE